MGIRNRPYFWMDVLVMRHYKNTANRATLFLANTPIALSYITQVKTG